MRICRKSGYFHEDLVDISSESPFGRRRRGLGSGAREPLRGPAESAAAGRGGGPRGQGAGRRRGAGAEGGHGAHGGGEGRALGGGSPAFRRDFGLEIIGNPWKSLENRRFSMVFWKDFKDSLGISRLPQVREVEAQARRRAQKLRGARKTLLELSKAVEEQEKRLQQQRKEGWKSFFISILM